MFRQLKRQGQDLTRAKPGRRFQNRYYQRKKRRPTPLLKVFYLMLGIALFVLGLILLFAPGPGLLVLLIGAAMMAQESLLVAKALDRAEVRVRAMLAPAKRAWRHASAALKTLVVACGAMFAAGAGWATYAVLFQ